MSRRFLPACFLLALITTGCMSNQQFELTTWGTAVMDHARPFLARGYAENESLRSREGLVLLRIQVDREGRLVQHAVERSSGVALLDEAAVKAIIQSSPLPKPPASLMPDKDLIKIVMPVQYQPQP
jgi:TonB family protein